MTQDSFVLITISAGSESQANVGLCTPLFVCLNLLTTSHAYLKQQQATLPLHSECACDPLSQQQDIMYRFLPSSRTALKCSSPLNDLPGKARCVGRMIYR